MVEAIKREQSLESQLNIIAQVIVENFSSFGVHGCIILLPDEEHKPSVLAEWPKSTDIIKLMADESVLGAAIYVMVHKEALILHLEGVLFGDNHNIFLRRIMTSTTGSIYTNRHYASMVPIHLTHDKVVVLLLLMEESDNLSISNKEEFFTKDGNLSPQTEFFWRINDQIKFVVEEARLQREQLELKILGREEKLHANLIQWVSHGLRSPLTMIKLDAAQATQVLQEIEPSYDKIHNSLQSIEHAANRLNHFVDDLLDMARSKGGMLKPRMSTYYIDDLVNEIVAEMKELIGDRSVAVNVPDLPLLKLDPIHIKHVLTNLIENAIRYTPADSLLEISAQIDGKHVQVDVADRGPGISPDDQKHLFEPYYQGNRKSRQGKGLGLAVCQALVEAQEGRIWVESREGGGTIFRFTLPLPKTGGEDESKGTMYSYRG